ncbi:hypothetical protein [Candidatus Palauibacter sp.]|uniref:hypothetical protein n=1 Tax=Candidatus Palauibacter sp. TaxID=3101350 RepID=UPI003B5A0F6D
MLKCVKVDARGVLRIEDLWTIEKETQPGVPELRGVASAIHRPDKRQEPANDPVVRA